MSTIPSHYSKTSPFLARVKKRKLLNKPGSTKKTYHITLDLTDSGITYEPGDSIAIIPKNPPELVEEICQHVDIDPEILHTKNLSRVTTAFAKIAGIQLMQTDLLDHVKGQNIPLKAFEKLPPLLPRFYSVASSQKVTPNSVDLLVATFTYEQNGHVRHGVGPRFLCDTDIVPLYVQPSTFRPVDTPMILIGPGTGVAPYRAFLQHCPGKHWLFFGERNRVTDFYYEEFFTSLPDLKISTAFSRDQEEKVYVQHRILEEQAELKQWIEEGARVYICGDRRHMAKDVVAALHTFVDTKALRKEKRLLLDVY